MENRIKLSKTQKLVLAYMKSNSGGLRLCKGFNINYKFISRSTIWSLEEKGLIVKSESYSPDGLFYGLTTLGEESIVLPTSKPRKNTNG